VAPNQPKRRKMLGFLSTHKLLSSLFWSVV